ncbi:MAG: hypothetical protein COA79_14905 [Planctomycetota bacterium]|nr:MAG: hypothetical protein COA79_14905 [Planctomycetota bacterium]
MKIWTIANFVTILRVLLIPVLLWCFYHAHRLDSWELWLASFLVLGFCELTDAFDGILARSLEQVSELGKLLDPLCDSLLRFSAFLFLSQLGTFEIGKLNIEYGTFEKGIFIGLIPWWTVYIFFFRDMSVAYLRIIAMSKGVVFAARLSGKLKAIVQAIGLFLIILLNLFKNVKDERVMSYMENINVQLVSDVTMWVVCAVTVWSGLDYAVKIFSMESIKEEN